MPRTHLFALTFLLAACDGATETPEGPGGPSAPTAASTPSAPSEPSAPSDPSVPSEPSAVGGVVLDVINKCSDPVDYCLVYDGVEKRTRLNGSSHEKFDVGEGATVRKDAGGSCGETLYTATSEGAQEFKLCE